MILYEKLFLHEYNISYMNNDVFCMGNDDLYNHTDFLDIENQNPENLKLTCLHILKNELKIISVKKQPQIMSTQQRNT